MSRKSVLLIFICLILAVSALPTAADDLVIIKYKFIPNELLRYNINVTANIGIQIDMPGVDQVPSIPVTMTGIMRQRTTKILPTGDAELAVAFESLSMSISGSVTPMDVSRMPVIKMVMSPGGQVKSSQGVDKLAAAFGGMPFMNMGSVAQNSSFPTKALSIGETWVSAIPFPLGGRLGVQSQLISANTQLASIKQLIKGNINLSAPLQNAQEAIVTTKGDVALDGNVYFALDKGQMVRSDASGNIQMTLSTPDIAGGMTADIKISMNMALIQDTPMPK
ncbi:MAG: hypothetical protein ACYC27_23360 [Armatimonadota bacterium]